MTATIIAFSLNIFFFPVFRAVRVDCTPSDMLVTVNFGQPFAGRVFATGNPQSCFEMGGDRSQIVLRISLGTQCGTLQQAR